jgi:large repetitive protein
MFLFHPAPDDRHEDIPVDHGSPGRSLLLALFLAAITALGGILTLPVSATSQPAPPDPTDDRSLKLPAGATVTLELTPKDDEIWLGGSRTYEATAVVTVDPNKAAAGNPVRELMRRDVTGLTEFAVTREDRPSGTCEEARCTPDTAGEHTVEGVVPKWFGRLLEGATTLRVLQPVTRLRLTPKDKTIRAGGSLRYTATGFAGHQLLRDVTDETELTTTPVGGTPIACPGAICVPTVAGKHTVTGTLREKGRKPVTGRANLTVVPREPETLWLDPDSATVQVDVGEPFQAMGDDTYGNELDLTEQAKFTISKGGSCPKAGSKVTCKAGKAGTYEVTATLRDSRLSASATLIVLPPPDVIQPSINGVAPDPASPNTEVVVTGTTGSCSRVGRLTLKGTDVRRRVRADFTTRFTVPSGLAPGDYRLLLDVTCQGKPSRATHTFQVDNQSPEPVDDPDATTLQDQAVSIPVTRNDKDPDDPDGYPTALEPGAPQHGTAQAEDEDGDGEDERVRYTPDKGFRETDQFQYRLCDVVAPGKHQCGTATVTVTVNPPEPKPVDDPDEATKQDQEVVIDVMGNDEHPDASRLQVLRPVRPGARAEKLADGHVQYTPEPGHVGEETFRYDYCGAAGTAAACPSATVTVNVEAPDDPQPDPEPEPIDDPDKRTPRDQPVTIDVAGNDRNPDAARLRVKDQPARGQAERLPGGAIRYTPDKGLTGPDQFSYDYCGDAPGAVRRTACPSATVTVTVEVPPDEPEPVDDPDPTTARDQSVTINVMGNDRNPDAARLRVKDQPAHGQAEKLADGTVRYTPEPGFAGPDGFSYDYCGDAPGAARPAACPSAAVSVTVTSDPVITSVRPASASPGKPVAVAGSTGSCSRAGTLTLEETGAVVHVTADRRGNFTDRVTVPKATAPRTYTLALAVACQGQAQRAERRITVTNRAPEAADDLDTTTRDHAVEVSVTENDRDPDDPDGYPTRLLAGPAINGSTEVRSDDTIVYTPNPGHLGQDQFQYSLCDDILNAAGTADCGIAATVTVSVTDTPAITSVSPPSAKPGTPVVIAGSTGSCNRAGTLTLEETGMVAQVAAEQNGNFTTILTIPDATYPRDYRLALRVDCTGTTQQAEATLSVTNERPQAADDEAVTVSGTAVPIDVTDNDRDPDDPDSYPTLLLVSGQPAHGTAEVQSERTILYTPEQDHVGPDEFRYKLCDSTLNVAGTADCGTAATVAVTVSDGGRCLAADDSSIRVEPGKGRGGARLGIIATVDRKLAACPFRLLLGESPLGADVRAGADGAITAQRAVPGNATPGTIPVRLATVRGDVVAQAPFEIIRPFPWLSNPLVKALLGLAALFTGALAQAAFRRLRPSGPVPAPDDDPGPPEDIQVDPQPGPVEAAVKPVDDGTRTVTVRLEPHPDPGTRRLQEEDP